MNATEQLADFIVSTKFKDFNPEVVKSAKKIVVDGTTVAFGGAILEEAPKLVSQYVQEMGGRPVSSVIGFGYKTSPVQAAFINGISMHVLDFEAMWQPPTHPTSPTLPVALAVAEWKELSGVDILSGLIIGFEVQGRIRFATDYMKPDELKMHPPGIVGVIGAAATASHMLGLSIEQCCHALGIAGSRAGSLMANIGTMTKSSHCGNAARLGLESAILAKLGYTANPNIMESFNGFVDNFFDDRFDFEKLTSGLGEVYRIVDPGLAYKMFPSQYGTHFGITAGLTVNQNEGFNPRAIEKVHIITPNMRYVDRPFPKGGLDGKFSFQYTVASALLDGKVDIYTFTDQRRFNPDMEDLLQKVVLEQRDDIPRSFEDMHVTVAATLSSGEEFVETCHRPLASWGEPFPEETFESKLNTCLGLKMEAKQIEKFKEMGNNFEKLNHRNVQDFMKLLSRAE